MGNVEDHMRTSVLNVWEQFDANKQLWFAQEIARTFLVEKVSSLVPENFLSARTLELLQDIPAETCNA
jgi:hypothetical protein